MEGAYNMYTVPHLAFGLDPILVGTPKTRTASQKRAAAKAQMAAFSS